jgi:tetratricopeptide (TPR) repeat protein
MAAFLGAPLGGAILIALNYVRLGNRNGARIAIVLGLAATAALIGLALWLPIWKSFPRLVLPLLMAWAIVGITEWLQGPALATRRAEGATMPSTWAAAATGLLCGVLIAGVVVAAAVSGWLAGPAERYYDRGVELQSRGDIDSAIIYYDSAIARKRTFAEAYYNRGLAYNAQGLLDREIADDDSALAHDPMLALAYLNRGIAYRKKGLIDRAIADYDSALARQPDLAAAWSGRSWS